jgi:hypothetical protein
MLAATKQAMRLNIKAPGYGGCSLPHAGMHRHDSAFGGAGRSTLARWALDTASALIRLVDLLHSAIGKLLKLCRQVIHSIGVIFSDFGAISRFHFLKRCAFGCLEDLPPASAFCYRTSSADSPLELREEYRAGQVKLIEREPDAEVRAQLAAVNSKMLLAIEAELEKRPSAP